MAAALQCPIGFSDHTLGINVTLAAVALGACVIEKHLTLDKEMEGPDHRASLDPSEFRALVDGIRLVESTLGSGEKTPVESERVIRDCVRKRLVARRDLSPGDVIAENDILFRRAPSGLTLSDWDRTVGRKLKEPVGKDRAIEPSMVEWE
jgi:sialic acid synthase SpsE